MAGNVVLLLGKAPKPGTIVADVLEGLGRAGVGTTVRLPHDEDVTLDDLADAALVVHRGLSTDASRLLPLLAAAGHTLCNPWSGTATLADRATMHAAIEVGGIPTPRATTATSWPRVLELAATRRVVVKAVSGTGRGQDVLAEPLPREAPGEGSWLVEELVPHDGVDRKLYVAGDRVHGLLKPSTLLHEHTTEGEPFTVAPDLADLGRRAARALDLHLLGVDVVIGPDGPVVVDVNPFPGYRGVPGAVESVTDHLLACLRSRGGRHD